MVLPFFGGCVRHCPSLHCPASSSLHCSPLHLTRHIALPSLHCPASSSPHCSPLHLTRHSALPSLHCPASSSPHCSPLRLLLATLLSLAPQLLSHLSYHLSSSISLAYLSLPCMPVLALSLSSHVAILLSSHWSRMCRFIVDRYGVRRTLILFASCLVVGQSVVALGFTYNSGNTDLAAELLAVLAGQCSVLPPLPLPLPLPLPQPLPLP